MQGREQGKSLITSIWTMGNIWAGYRICHAFATVGGGDVKSVGICIIVGGTIVCGGKLSTFSPSVAFGSWII